MRTNILKYSLFLAMLVVALSGVMALDSLMTAVAHIEEAIKINKISIDFGVISPNEALQDTVEVGLTDVLLGDEGVEGVEYVITQKTRCKIWEGSECKEYFESLCPFLDEVSAEGEGDTNGNASLNRIHDISDVWNINLSGLTSVGNYSCELWVGVTGIQRTSISKKIPSIFSPNIARAFEAHIVVVSARIGETTPDLWIKAIRPVQVVWDSDINEDGIMDLVAGKTTMVRVEIGGIEELPDNPFLYMFVWLTLEEYAVDYPLIKFVDLDNLRQKNWVDFYLTPHSLGSKTITAEIKPAFAEANKTNNTTSTVVTIKDTYGLYLVYYPIDRACDFSLGIPPICGGYGPINMEDYATTVVQSGKFIEATYPIITEEFFNKKRNTKYYGSLKPFLGMFYDALGLWAWAELSTKTQADRVVGIVPEDYFEYHSVGLLPHKDWGGKFFPRIPTAVLVENNNWTTVAHEIEHTYDNSHWPKAFPYLGPGEEYETNPPFGNPASGFWVEEQREIYPYKNHTGKGGICFMGQAGENYSFYYDPSSWMPIWIDKDDYEYLFQEFRIDKTDPPDVLLVSGLIFDDDTLELMNWYRVANGIIDENIVPGDYSLQILDTNNQLIMTTSFDAAFETFVDSTGTTKGVSGFAFVIPYPDNAAKILIQHSGQILIELNPNAKLLHDAVDLIPDYGFLKNSSQRRSALHNKINAVEKMLEENNDKDALQKLEHDIKDKIKKWILNDFSTENPLQFTKNGLLELIDEIIERVNLIN